MKRIIPLIIVLFISMEASPVIDSLNSLLEESRGRERIDLLNELSMNYKKLGRFVNAFEASGEAVSLSEIDDYPEGRAKSVEYFAYALSDLNETPRAIEYSRVSLALYRELGDNVSAIRVLNGLIHFYLITGNQVEAEKVLREQAGNILKIEDENLRAETYIELSGFWGRIGRSAEAREMIDRGLSLFEKTGDYPGIAKTYLKMINYDIINSGKEASAGNFARLTGLFGRIQDKKLIVNCLNDIGDTHLLMNNYVEALDLFERALDRSREIGYPAGEAFARGRSGYIYAALENNETALEYYRDALEIYQKLDNKIQVATYKNNIGLTYSALGYKEKALGFLYESLKTNGEAKYTLGIYNIINSIGTIYYESGDYGKAAHNFLKALKLKKENRNHRTVFSFLVDAGRAFRALGRNQEALLYLGEALELGKRITPARRYLIMCYENLYKIYESLNEKDRAYHFLGIYSALRDSLRQTERSEVMLKFHVRQQIASKEKEIELLVKESKIRDLEINQANILRNSLIVVIILVVIIVFIVYNRYRTKERINKKLVRINKKIVKDQELAKKLQFSLLPKDYPDDEYVKFFGQLIPSENLSGDFYDVFRVSDTKIAAYIIDVCGHGVSSAIITVFLRDLVESMRIDKYVISQPAIVLEKLNSKMIEANFVNEEFKWFSTMFYGVFDRSTYELTYASAAHNTVYRIISGESPEIENVFIPSFAIGWFDNVEFEQNTLKLSPNDKLLMLTDGILEASEIDSDDQFGTERLYDSIRNSYSEIRAGNLGFDTMLDNLKNDVFQFSKGNMREDDITMFLMDLKG